MRTKKRSLDDVVTIRIPDHAMPLRFIEGPVQAGTLSPALGDLVHELIAKRDALRKQGRGPAAQQREQQAVEIMGLLWPARTEPLRIDLGKLCISWRGTVYDCRSENALRLLQVLVDHAGEWISAKNLGRYDPFLAGCRPHKLKRYLPPEIRQFIESSKNPRQGTRIKRSPM